MPTDLEKEEDKVLKDLDNLEDQMEFNASPMNKTHRANKEFALRPDDSIMHTSRQIGADFSPSPIQDQVVLFKNQQLK